MLPTSAVSGQQAEVSAGDQRGGGVIELELIRGVLFRRPRSVVVRPHGPTSKSDTLRRCQMGIREPEMPASLFLVMCAANTLSGVCEL